MRGARRWRLPAAALASLALGAALLGSAAPASAATPSSEQLVGIAPSTKLSYLEYARMALGGVQTLRVPLFWEDLQPGRGVYDWQSTDEIVAYAAYFGIRLRPFVMGVPDWVQHASGSSDYPPVHSAIFKRTWRRLLGQLVERYGPDGLLWRFLHSVAPRIRAQPITTWQIWNEPNAHTYWRPGQTAPAAYADLLRLSAQAIRAHDPQAQVIAAGLFLTPLDGMRMPRFVNQLYQQPGIASNFDALAIHPYARNVAGVLSQIRIARRLMARNGDEEKPLWITELGWPTQRSFGRGLFVKSEGAQKRLLTRTFRAILSRRAEWKIGSLIWYTWRDNDFFTTCDLCRFSGLFRKDLTAKPAWQAFVHFSGGTARVPTATSVPGR